MISVIIPTLLKNTEILEMLLNTLNKDEIVSEIIIINNSTQDYKSSLNKVRILNPKENLFVNPSWNLGVKEAKEEYFALFNDDLLVEENFCSKCYEKIKNIEAFGCMGVKTETVVNTKELIIPQKSNLEIEEDNEERCLNWGIIIFGKKSLYKPIPEDIKVWCGDDFIRFQTNNAEKKIYSIKNCEILHLGSLSSNNAKLEIIKCFDVILYGFIDKNFKNQEVYNRYKQQIEFYFENKKIIIKNMENKLKNKIKKIISIAIFILLIILIGVLLYVI